MKNFWRIIGLLMLVGVGIAIVRWVRRSSRQKTSAWDMPAPQTAVASRIRALRSNIPGEAASSPPTRERLHPASEPRSASSELPMREVEEQVPDKDMPDQPPSPPPPLPFAIFTRSLEGLETTEQGKRLWLTLQNEAFRQRGEGFREDWAFPLYATRHDFGAPVAKGSRLNVNGTQYALQPFARDVLFNEIPRWSQVQDLSTRLGGTIPAGGLTRQLLEASFQSASGNPLHPDWAFHQLAVSEKIGPALSANYRIKVSDQEYSMQVFACDTLYTPVPHWSDVRRLSETTPGELATALWAETYKTCNVPFLPDTPAHQFAMQEKIGTPLSGVYQIDFEGSLLDIQVFATDVIFAETGGSFTRQCKLSRPDKFALSVAPPAPAAISTPGAQEDAVSNQRPIFALLPVAGQPRISQFYGDTKFCRGAPYYGACQGMHPGIDFAVPEGTPLLSVGYGLVVYAGPSEGAPFGGAPPMIAIVRYGSLYVIYGHSSAMKVQKGQFVGPGDVVTRSGNYGGPHLHFEIRPVPAKLLSNTDPNQPAINPGTTMNPLDYFSADLQPYFERWFNELGGNSHFCRGGLHNQPEIVFGGPVETRPCTN